MGKYRQKLADIQVSLERERPDMLVSLLKALFISLAIFTFLSGLIFTVIPLTINIWGHIMLHIVQPINAWIAEEPVFGRSMIFVLEFASTLMFLWFIRKYVILLWMMVLAFFEKKPPTPAPKKTATKPARKPATKTFSGTNK